MHYAILCRHIKTMPVSACFGHVDPESIQWLDEWTSWQSQWLDDLCSQSWPSLLTLKKFWHNFCYKGCSVDGRMASETTIHRYGNHVNLWHLIYRFSKMIVKGTEIAHNHIAMKEKASASHGLFMVQCNKCTLLPWVWDRLFLQQVLKEKPWPVQGVVHQPACNTLFIASIQFSSPTVASSSLQLMGSCFSRPIRCLVCHSVPFRKEAPSSKQQSSAVHPWGMWSSFFSISRWKQPVVLQVLAKSRCYTIQQNLPWNRSWHIPNRSQLVSLCADCSNMIEALQPKPKTQRIAIQSFSQVAELARTETSAKARVSCSPAQAPRLSVDREKHWETRRFSKMPLNF